MPFPYPFFQVQFQADGAVYQQAEVDALLGGIQAANAAPTDLLVMCHGWNNDIPDALDLYGGLADVIKQQIDGEPQLVARKFAICGLLWPSKKFDEADLIPSGAAALNDAITTDHLKARVDDLCALYTASGWPGSTAPPPEFAEIKSLMDQIENQPTAQTEAIILLRSLLPQEAASTDDASKRFFDLPADLLAEKLSKGLMPPPIQAGAGAASLHTLDPFHTSGVPVSGLGGAAGFRDVLGGIKSGFSHLMNFTTFYLMKARAGDVGVKGAAPLLVKMRDARPDLRVHMIGHSFGCRATSAAINTLPADDKYRPDTVLLLQGAFSHNGFAEPSFVPAVDRGVFRDVVAKAKVRGPILITHTRNDKAVGLAYPIASRIAGVTAAALGDANDIYGGLGSNGTQTPTTTREGVAGNLLPVQEVYLWAGGVHPSTPYNLQADAYIGGHSDVRKPEVAHALVTALTLP